ncbi:MAG: glycoside hydrolase family 13 protein [Lachnospiraceae bacterium]|nr:glycoside hydrolase family 13 protein [Lachnospiraceae bacterium]
MDAYQNLQYLYQIKPLFNAGAVFSDTTRQFVSPAEPNPFGRVQIKLRTARDNIDSAWIVSNLGRIQMFYESSQGLFDNYIAEVQLEDTEFSYYFEITSGKLKAVYDIRGISKSPEDRCKFRLFPGYKTPAWAHGAVIYQIYADRFRNGDPSNDVLTHEYSYINRHSFRVEDWKAAPAAFDVSNFYGGDLQGVLDKLDYLVDLGVEVIYFNPLFVSPSNHKYDIQDYDHVDPHFTVIRNDGGELLKENDQDNRNAERFIRRVVDIGNLEESNRWFAGFVDELHKRGIRIILDGVFNHCGSFNKWMDRERIYEGHEGYEPGAFISYDSPYRDFFSFNRGSDWPYNTAYDGWWGHDTLPKLNYEGSAELMNYIMRIARKWVSPPYNCDGWRIDVAADIGHSPEFNHTFFREFRRNVKEANPEAVIIAEHYGSPRDWLNGREWDSVMNYDAFMDPVSYYLTGMEKHSDDFRGDLYRNSGPFWGAMIYNSSDFPTVALECAMNELDNHDHSRFLTRTNHKVGRVGNLGAQAASEDVNPAVLREAVVMQMTWIGCPGIYYGDEAGVCGFTDPDSRRTYPWGEADQSLVNFYREMIKIHKECSELKTGSFRRMKSPPNVLAYGRFDENGASLIAVNNTDKDAIVDDQVWYLGIPRNCIMKRLMLTNKDGYSSETQEYPVVMGRLSVTVPSEGAVILRYKAPQIHVPEVMFGAQGGDNAGG